VAVSQSALSDYRGVRITDDMEVAAQIERTKREPYIQHHFETACYTQEQTDMMGFYGEFALRSLLGIDWKSGIRPNYYTIDDCDLLVNGWVIDAKTESIPAEFIWLLIRRTIRDNE
jgi:hypothetical protein